MPVDHDVEQIKEEEIYMPENLPEHNKPDESKPVKSALHGQIRREFYSNFYVCVPTPNHYKERCICEFTDTEVEPLIEWITDRVDLGKAAGREENAERLEYAEKLLDDVVCLYVKNLEDDTSLMKKVRKLMKTRLDEGKPVTVAWGWLDDRDRLTPQAEQKRSEE